MRRRIGILILGVLLSCGGLAQATNIDFNSVNPVGTIQAGDNYDQVTLHDSAVVTMTGGSAYTVWSYDSSTFQMQSGNVTGWIGVSNSSSVTLSGGLLKDLELRDSGIATILGGNITGSLGIFGTAAVAHIYGKNFGATPNGAGWLITGDWADNSPFTIFYRAPLYAPPPSSSGPYVFLHTIPEPATLFLFGFGMIFARRKSSK